MVLRARRALVAGALLGLVGGLLTSGVTSGVASAADEKPAPIADKVKKTLAEKGAADLWVVFDEKANLSGQSKLEDWKTRGDEVVRSLRQTAAKSQASTISLLKSEKANYEAFWISNRIRVDDASTELAAKLAVQPGVRQLSAPQALQQPAPSKATRKAEVNAVEWGIAAIKADQTWANFGVRGEGITVANVDSGVQFDHPALVGKYRGNLGDGSFDHNYNFYDPSVVCSNRVPCTINEHGTHTMGTMVGDDGAGNQIGVAPGARWISALGCDIPPRSCSDSALLKSGQWLLEPRDQNGENPRTDLRPQVINNSWGASNGSAEDPFYDDIVGSWNSAGIFSVFSNGNSGPGCDTTGSPADSLLSYGVGAFTSSGTIASFSSRGPGANGEIRPNISAPGDNVRSSVPGNGYGSLGGTSMAAPHLAATVALMWSAAPSLVGNLDLTKTLLDDTATDVSNLTCGGTADDNNVWGEGKVDALAAVTASPRGDTGTLSGTVTDASTGSALGGVQVTIAGPTNRTVTTAADGKYQLPLTVGDYTVTAKLYGYGNGTGAGTVVKDQTTTVDLALTPVGSWPVLGEVADARGNPLQGATVRVEGSPLAPAVTAADGSYEFPEVPVGTYTISVTSPSGCSANGSRSVTIDARKIVNFRLADQTDSYGYHCEVGNTPYVEGDTPLELSGDESSVGIDLPFRVVHYGVPYSKAYVSTNGHINFLAAINDYSNDALPDTATPNAAIYALWDDMDIDDQSKVYTKTSGTAPYRTFLVEWRNAKFYSGTETQRVDFEAVLHEGGDIELAYRGIDANDPLERGNKATVGIENGTGTDATQFAYEGDGVLSDAKSAKFALPANGYVSGTVADANDKLPIDKAVVAAVDDDGKVVKQAKTSADGKYFFQLPVGPYTVKVTKQGYTGDPKPFFVSKGKDYTGDFVLKTGAGAVNSSAMKWLLPRGVKQTAKFTVKNNGSAPLSFKLLENGGARQSVAAVAKQSKTLAAKADRSARTAKGRYPAGTKRTNGVGTQSVGHPVTKWPVTGLPADGVAWGAGVGPTGNLWVSEPSKSFRNYEYAPDGKATGRNWVQPWATPGWNGDLTYDSRRKALCQVAVGADNGIHCFDPNNGAQTYVLTGSPWSSISQRGVAYRADDDSFYIGGWNQDVVYHVAGASAPTPGALLGKCDAPTDTGIAGLAWNPTSGTVWVTTSSANNAILQLNPETCAVVSSTEFPSTEAEFAGAGSEFDSAGSLWAVSQNTNTAYKFEVGDPISTDVPWLSVSAATGTLEPGGSAEYTVTVDSTGLASGKYKASVLVSTDGGRQSVFEVPVELVVSGVWKAIDVGSTVARRDVAGIPWSADKAYTAGTYGYLGTSTVKTAPSTVDIRDTVDDPLFRSQREGMDAYRFDALPAGTYDVTLDFAELAASPAKNKRVFDVELNGATVLRAYDIATTVGGQKADRKTFQVKLTATGNLLVSFFDRTGFDPSVVNNVRIVHRPDIP